MTLYLAEKQRDRRSDDGPPKVRIVTRDSPVLQPKREIRLIPSCRNRRGQMRLKARLCVRGRRARGLKAAAIAVAPETDRGMGEGGAND
jgi:hypothetical protein